MVATIILYKYVTAERVLTCLPEVGDGTLRATQPASLNDPFECAVGRIHVVSRTSVEPSKREENRLYAEALTRIHEASPVSEGDVNMARYEYGSLYLRELLTRQLSRRFGIVSFSENPRHPLMWSHYTTDGSGFVIGYDREQLEKLSSRDRSLSPVHYKDQLDLLTGYEPVGWPEGRLNVLLSTKSSHWDYEKEWRLIVELNETIGVGQRDRHGQPINLLRVPNSAVMEVYCTERTPKETVRRVLDRLTDRNNRYKQTDIKKLVMSPKDYGYEEAELKVIDLPIVDS